MGKVQDKNIFAPEFFSIKRVKKETPDVKSFVIDKECDSEPGQFYEVALLGYGEAPISTGSPKGAPLLFGVKLVGTVTKKLHKLKPGNFVGLRGPFGNGWPKDITGDVVLVGGGIGLPPLRSFMLTNLKTCRMRLFYGARTPADLVFKSEYDKWKKLGVEVNLTVDKPAHGWKGNVGPVTTIISSLAPGTKVLICGPPIMIRFVLEKCAALGIKSEDIYVSMERLMRCGVGKCGHCMIGGSYVCRDGPVYRSDRMPNEQK